MLDGRLRLRLLLRLRAGDRDAVAPLQVLLAHGVLVEHGRTVLGAVEFATGLEVTDVDEAVPALAAFLPVVVPTRSMRQRIQIVASRELNIFLRCSTPIIRIDLARRHV